ncbi:MAG: hypothetical protein GX130_04155 [Candidatus Hydrogenedens sp.]|jgi:hypothetical protein|nr:hypothetical protein [Candidatus Hydrogenedens sp.]
MSGSHCRHPFILCLALLFSLALLWAKPVAAEREQRLDARKHSLLVSFQDAEPYLSLVAGCRVRLFSADQYSILCAHGTKQSSHHWELFTTPGNGILHLYAPGRTPDHVRSSFSLTDGKWHEVLVLQERETVQIIVDGNIVAEETAPAKAKSFLSDELSWGALVEGGFGCDGLLADAFLATNPETDLTRFFQKNAFIKESLAFWSFASQDPGKDGGPLGKDGLLRPAGSITVNPSRQIPGGMPVSFQELPPAEDAQPLREALKRAAHGLNLSCLVNPMPGDAVLRQWHHDYSWMGKKEYPDSRPGGPGAEKLQREVFDSEALTVEGERPLHAVLRRTDALLNHLDSADDLHPEKEALQTLQEAAKDMQLRPEREEEKELYLAACALRRRIVLSNPLLDFDTILCLARGTFEGSVRSNPTTQDSQGGHFVTQYFGFNALPGGGLYFLSNYKGEPEIIDLLKDSVVMEGAMKGRKLDHGAFATPDLSWDGETILFAWTANPDHQWIYSEERCFHLFKVNKDGSNLIQLTDGAYNDFDPCWLPDGRIAFVSERRGGYIRCFDASLKVRSYTLFSMNDRGEDIRPLSYFETSEWNPSVNNEGQLVFTRWDYVDRENCLGTRFWISGPDGSDARAPHGNYPHPYHTFSDHQPWQGETGKERDSRFGAPLVEMGIRAIPHSPRYIFTAAPHHGSVYGSLCMLDLRGEDDGHMSQIRRITPEEAFPETEMPARRHYRYGTPWPLSEDFYLCNEWENLVLLDRFGNKELLCDLPSLPCAHDERLRVINPIPLKARPRPMANPTLPAKDSGSPATIAVMDVYNSDLPLPEYRKIKWLRVVQNILKSNHAMGDPMIGYERENTPRIPLGIVPVEADGSVYFEAPVGKQLIFQLLDEDFMAVQSMRSSAFVHPGEQLTCLGCHESPHHAAQRTTAPLAMRRPPSRLEPECGDIEPISYYRQIRPIFENRCLPCHREEKTGPQDMSYEALKEDYTFWFSGAMFGDMTTAYSGVHGGSRTIPGRFGAYASKIGQTLIDDSHWHVVSEEDRRMIFLWLDCNSLRLGAYTRVEEQMEGALIWPDLDVDPANLQGTESGGVGLKRNFWHENLWGPFPLLITDVEKECIAILNEEGERIWEHPVTEPLNAFMLDDGTLLIAQNNGLQRITRDHVLLWEYSLPEGDRIVSCQPLSQGEILLGVAGKNRLLVLSAEGEVLRSLPVPDPSDRASHLSSCALSEDDRYLVAYEGEKRIRGYDADGKCWFDIFCEEIPNAIRFLKSGHFMTVSDRLLCEYDREGRRIWEALGPDFADISSGTFASLHPLESGNILVSNRGGEGDHADALFELTRDHRVVWKLKQGRSGSVSHCQALADTLAQARPSL